jgi:hypothetical protein
MSTSFTRRRQLLGFIATSAGLSACGGGGSGNAATPASTTPVVTTPVAATPTPVTGSTTPVTTTPAATAPVSTAPVADPALVTPVIAKSAKRGIAYDIASTADMKALAPGVSWFYNWGVAPSSKLNLKVDAIKTAYQVDYFPMEWNASADTAAMTAYLLANPGIKYLLLMNEPNLVDQARLTPAEAAVQWPKYEAIAKATGVKLVGPQITWGTLANFADPVAWMDAFLDAYQSANGGRSPQIDYLGFHWYDYGLNDQLESLVKYGKPFWVTEMANWHSNDGAQIDTLAKQKTQMTEMVALCEGRADVFRYAWFIGRMSPDPHFTSLLGADGVLTELGQLYLSLPYKTA